MSESARPVLKHLYKEGRMTEEQYQKIDRNLKERPQWIPCSERLPDDGGVFLVTTVSKSVNGNDVYIVEVMSLWHKDGHLEWRDNFVFESEWHNKKAVAWMELPEPYRKEGENE